MLRAKVPASAVEAARAELGKLPIGFDVAAQRLIRALPVAAYVNLLISANDEDKAATTPS